MFKYCPKATGLACALAIVIAAIVAVGCGQQPGTNSAIQSPPTPGQNPTPAGNDDFGLIEGYTAEVIARGLMNPSSIGFRADGTPTICDTGHGRVVLVQNGKLVEYITGFDTEFWKVPPASDEKRYKVGPLSAVWLPDGRLAVTDAGKPNAAETIRFYPGAGPAYADDIAHTNGVGPTTEKPTDTGEGNLCGMCLSPDNSKLYVCGQGEDSKTWVLVCHLAEKKLATLLSADEHGIETNSPMQAIMHGDNKLLVVYSGAVGKEDGLIVEWNLETKKPANVWKLPGIADPMALAPIPGKDGEFVVTDNRWALKAVDGGHIARVKLAAGSDTADVTVIATKVPGPVACAFGPDGRLYVTALGEMFDTDKGFLMAIGGFEK